MFLGLIGVVRLGNMPYLGILGLLQGFLKGIFKGSETVIREVLGEYALNYTVFPNKISGIFLD